MARQSPYPAHSLNDRRRLAGEPDRRRTGKGRVADMACQSEIAGKTSRKLRLVALAAPAVLALLLAGCSGTGFRTHAQILSEKAEIYIAAHPELSDKTKQDIRLFRLHKGMSKPEVIAAWGRPVIVRKYSRDGLETWYFGCDWPHTCSYPDEDTDFPLIDEVYESQAVFEDGRLVSWRG